MSTFDQITLNYGILGAIPSAEVFSPRFGIVYALFYTETDLQFCDLVTKILTIISEGADDRVELRSYHGPRRIKRSGRVPLVVIGLYVSPSSEWCQLCCGCMAERCWLLRLRFIWWIMSYFAPRATLLGHWLISASWTENAVRLRSGGFRFAPSTVRYG